MGIEPDAKIDVEIISDYVERIKAGENPKVITLSAYNGNLLYIINGHHQFKAYQQLN